MKKLHEIKRSLDNLGHHNQHESQQESQQESQPQQPPTSSISSYHPKFNPHIPNTESAALAEKTFQYFYSEQNNQFQAKVKSESTLDAENHFGYVVWPVSIMLHATADCLSPQRVHQAISAHREYWNPEMHAFCAWKMFPGNKDIYYDDNGHAVQAFISSYQATGEISYLWQAEEILKEFIIPKSYGRNGTMQGIPWHISNDKVRAACSIGPAVISALRLRTLRNDGVGTGIIQREEADLVTFAKHALTWLKRNLQDPEDKLIWDQLIIQEDGSVNINKKKWTYNSGFAIHGFTLLYKAAGDIKVYLDYAEEIARAVMNPNGPLFDHCIPDPSQRMLSDGSFFLHHLVDGYLALSQHTLTKELRNDLRNEIIRIADWGRKFMKDPNDGLYYRGSRPYTISTDHVRMFRDEFGSKKGLEVEKQERDVNGNLCKTMLGCASWARILRAAEIVQESRAEESMAEERERR